MVKDDRFLLKEGLWKGRYLHDLYQEGNDSVGMAQAPFR
jgi:hypothetical protein